MTLQLPASKTLPQSAPMTDPTPDLTNQLRGREIAEVRCNGSVVLLITRGGGEIAIKWVDDNGVTLRGKPVIGSKGFRLACRGMQDVIYAPQVSGLGN